MRKPITSIDELDTDEMERAHSTGRGPDHPTCEQALLIAYNALRARPPHETNVMALAVLRDILIQRGCDACDHAVRDGKLTTYMDVIIYG